MAQNVKDRIERPIESGLERYVGLEHLDTGSLKIWRWGSTADVEKQKLLFKKGDIIFGRRNAYLRRVAVADFDGVCSAHALVLRAKEDIVLPEFLPFFMQTDQFWETSFKVSAGSMSPTINWPNITKEEFALPPLAEQRRMAEVLWAANGINDAYRQSLQACENVLRSLQKQYFIEQPEGEKVKIGEVAKVQNGTTPRRSRPEYWEGDVPWLPTGKVNERFISIADEYITQKALSECSLNIIPAGSTLIAMIGQGLTRGKSARLEIDATINQNFGAVIPSEDIDSWYLFYQLEIFYELLRSWSHGTNQHALNCALIRDFPIWLPNIERQREIATELRKTDSAVQTLRKQISHGELLQTNLREFAL
jgi:type I restriction enzyme S subunit